MFSKICIFSETTAVDILFFFQGYFMCKLFLKNCPFNLCQAVDTRQGAQRGHSRHPATGYDKYIVQYNQNYSICTLSRLPRVIFSNTKSIFTTYVALHTAWYRTYFYVPVLYSALHVLLIFLHTQYLCTAGAEVGTRFCLVALPPFVFFVLFYRTFTRHRGFFQPPPPLKNMIE